MKSTRLLWARQGSLPRGRPRFTSFIRDKCVAESNGFTLVEILTAVMILTIGLFAVLTVFTTALKASITTKARTTAIGMANEEVETLRSLSYEQAYLTDDNTNLMATGEITFDGSDYYYDDDGVDRQVIIAPSGIKANVNDVTTNRNGIQYRVRTYVVWVDDAADDVSPADTDPQDYKRAIVKVSWSSPGVGSEFVVATNFLKTATTVYPTIVIDSPNPDKHVTDTEEIATTANANESGATITKVVFYLYEPDGSLAETSSDITSAPYNWDLNTLTACGGQCPDGYNYNVKATVFTDTGRDDSDTVRLAIDNTRPDKDKIVELDTISSTSNSITLSWEVAADIDGVFPPFKYRIYRREPSTGYEVVAEIKSDGDLDGLYTNTGLTANTRYFYRMQVVDHVGLESQSVAERDLTTAVSSDTTPPTFPGGAALTAVPTAWSSVSLEWTASIDPDTIGYEVRRYSSTYSTWLSIVSPLPDNEMDDSDLEPETTYSYRVYAIDAVGNLSATYLEADATTDSR